jgi:hypothetical protein
MNELLLSPEQRLHFESELCEVMSVCRVYPNEPVMNFADGLVRNICQDQLNKVQQKQSEALQDFTENKITFERLAEQLNINFYELHTAFEKYKGTIKVD